ncbi:MAG TPA: undecaprenyl-diphosphatase UppP [Thermoleophilia bacterium]|nr:undecaprenyl-diphosphatase UppP [Thermoleophilia bacterium]
MTILQAIILGIVQGLTEFLPISSSGHLLLVPWLFNWHFLLENPELNKTFDVALHLGTFVAVVLYFWREIVRLVGAWVRSLSRRSLAEPEAKLAWLLIVSTVPAALVGVLFEDFITNTLGKPWMIGVAMIVFAGFMYLVDHIARLDRDLEALTWLDALLIGIAQSLALLPGVSRSGITMMTGLLVRLDRESAARYSFLMSIPVIGGAAAFKGLEVARDGLPAGTATPFAVGMVAAALSGIAAIWFTLAYLKRHNFNLFVVYRIVIGVGVLVLIVAGVRSGMAV